MKKITTVLLALSTALFTQSCGNAAKDSTAKADSINQTNDSSDKKHPGVPGTEVSGDDAAFAVKAANGGLAEVQLGALAKEKGSTMPVRDFGAMMMTDHNKANEELKFIAESKHIVLPDSLNNEAKKLKAELAAKSGADFDKAYIQAMVDDHKEDISEFERAEKVVKYPELQAFVKKTLPVLRMHLAAIQKIQSQTK
jgi:putative membrane protein